MTTNVMPTPSRSREGTVRGRDFGHRLRDVEKDRALRRTSRVQPR